MTHDHMLFQVCFENYQLGQNEGRERGFEQADHSCLSRNSTSKTHTSFQKEKIIYLMCVMAVAARQEFYIDGSKNAMLSLARLGTLRYGQLKDQ